MTSVYAASFLVLALFAGALAEESAAPVLSIKDAKVAITQDGSTVLSNAGEYPATLLSNPQIPLTQQLEVTLSVLKDGEPFKPQQVFLKLQSKANGLASYAVAKAKKTEHVLTVSAAAIEKQSGLQGGEYDVSVLVGDPSAPAGVTWSLGTVELVVPEGKASLPAFKTSTFQPLNDLKPEIHHIFRSAEKHPPAAVSLAFAALAFAPLPITIVAVLSLTGINFKAFSFNPQTTLYALLFHVALGLMLALYLLFWVKLNLAQTLPAVGLLGLVVAFLGYKALSGLAAARLYKKE